MRYVKQIGIILGITLAGEILNHVVPPPVPSGVYGLFRKSWHPRKQSYS